MSAAKHRNGKDGRKDRTGKREVRMLDDIRNISSYRLIKKDAQDRKN